MEKNNPNNAKNNAKSSQKNSQISLKEKFEVLSVEDLLNLKKIYRNTIPLLNDVLFGELIVIYCDEFRDRWKILTKTECTCKLSKLIRSFDFALNHRQFIRVCSHLSFEKSTQTFQPTNLSFLKQKLELIGDLTPIFNSTNFFEEFESLEVLEIFDKNEFKSPNPESYTLKLKKLKKLILHFYCEPNRMNPVTLETPSLDWLCCNFDLRIMTCLYPETITTLQTDDCLGGLELVNLETLWMTSFSNYKCNFFKQFSNIKDFHFLDSDPSSINNLLNEMKSLNKSLNLWHNNILINQIGLLDNYSVIFDYNLLKFYQKHESRLVDRLHFIKDIQLTFDLDQIPKSFYSRFKCISHIKIAHKIENYDLFALLIRSCEKLGSIRLKCCPSQKFIDSIPDLAPLLNRLVVDQPIEDLSFLVRLTELTYLSLEEQELPIWIFKRWVKSHSFLTIIQFYYGGRQFSIEFLDDSVFFCDIVMGFLLIKPLDELTGELDQIDCWDTLFDRLVSVRELDKKLDNLAFKIDIEPEIRFANIS